MKATQLKNGFLQIGICLLIILWVYTATSKIIDFPAFKREMFNQAFGRPVAQLLIYSLPTIEILAALLAEACLNNLAGKRTFGLT